MVVVVMIMMMMMMMMVMMKGYSDIITANAGSFSPFFGQGTSITTTSTMNAIRALVLW